MDKIIEFYENKITEYINKYCDEKRKNEILLLRINSIVEQKEDDISVQIKEVLKNNK